MKHPKFLKRKLLLTAFGLIVLGLSVIGIQIVEKEMGISLQANVLSTSDFFFYRASASDSTLSSAKEITLKNMAPKIIAQAIVPDEILTSIACSYKMPRYPEYDAEVLVKSSRVSVQPSEDFTVTIQAKNIGNVPWFSDASGCSDNPVRLGTTHARDRESIFYNPGDSRFLNAHRISMQELRVNPGETATFVFASKAPNTNDIFREYFAPIAEGTAWMDNRATAHIDIFVGEITQEQESKAVYLGMSGQTDALNISGPQVLDVSLGEQKLRVKFGDTVVREYTVSTGLWKTPTPRGTFTVSSKQELRIEGKAPHYRMPYWLGFTAAGHGFHALPYLANDEGAFWQEAYNHIGIPVSHGCVRLLPQDAEDLFSITEIGTTIVIHS